MAMGNPHFQNENVKGKSSIDSINLRIFQPRSNWNVALSEIAVAAKEHLTSMLWPLQPGPHRRGRQETTSVFPDRWIFGIIYDYVGGDLRGRDTHTHTYMHYCIYVYNIIYIYITHYIYIYICFIYIYMYLYILYMCI